MKLQVPQKYFGSNYFSSGSYDTYKDDVFSWTRPTAEKILSFLKDVVQPVVLDVGCAHGYFMTELQNNYGVKVRGLECSTYAIKNAEKSVKGGIVKGSVLDTFHFLQDSFDAVICFEVFQYLNSTEIKKAAENLTYWARKYIFFCAPYKHSRHNSQRINPDKYRISVLTQKEYVKLFESGGAKFVARFNSGNGGDILAFKKKVN